ncbi:hypothetical protein FB567DRAFT_552865 [Paraphoma chrysanthemicola]|uniref:Uncharacterized protein n=1 Tax=Paraphoma chrysanthemicola TaxID=798071 RepID=A0A8K0QYF3_9PLEO|nr:hypothetical protein FB567DRAFT_552865 [Paraphoma chrysanthemicola]
MGTSWITLSTGWSLSKVQAALNFIISFLGTVAIWACSRYWWQRGGKKVLEREKSQAEVPLPKILNLAGPGDGFDAFMLLRWKIFSRPNISLLFQLLVILIISSALTFAGPLAQVSLRSTQVVRLQDLQVLKAHKSGGRFGNSLNDNVKWNSTMESLNKANFPYDQLLNVLPPPDVPWTYRSNEWDPVWRAECSFHGETLLDNLEATGVDPIVNALDAFPQYRSTYNASWLNRSEIRSQSYFNGETSFTGGKYLVKDLFLWFVLQSDPIVNDRMRTNTEPMKISISALHLKNFSVDVRDDATQAGVNAWRPTGVVTNASYSRVECNIKKKPGVTGGDSLPWVWSNDTYSLTQAYRANWFRTLSEASLRNETVIPPTPHQLFRFYQAYVIATNTWQPFPGGPVTQRLSVWKDTVQLSTACLVFLLFLLLLDSWLSVRYAWFLRRNKQKLKKTFIPDGKTDWMLHCAKLAAHEAQTEQFQDNRGPKDRDYFRRASFGNVMDPELGIKGLARVYASPNITARSKSDASTLASPTPRIIVQTDGTNDVMPTPELNPSPSPTVSFGSTGLSTASTMNEGANSIHSPGSRASSVTFCLTPSALDTPKVMQDGPKLTPASPSASIQSEQAAKETI